MGELTFSPMSAPSELPYRDRNAFDGYDTFIGEALTVLVNPAARDQARRAAEAAAPIEMIGLLLGRAFHDADGEFTVGMHVVIATDRDASPGHVRLTPEQNHALRNKAFGEAGAWDVVGWVHSHGSESDFSHVDRGQQATWTKPTDLGLLVFMRGPAVYRVYSGPHAEPMVPVTSAQPAPATFTSIGPRAAAPATPIAPFSAVPPRAPTDKRLPVPLGHAARRDVRWLVTLGISTIALATAAIALATATGGGVSEADTASNDPVMWNCDTATPNLVSCNVVAARDDRLYEWRLSDGANPTRVAMGPTAAFPTTTPGPYQVSVRSYTLPANDSSPGTVIVPEPTTTTAATASAGRRNR